MKTGWEIVHFENSRGEQPVVEFVRQLPINVRTKTVQLIGVLSEKGYEVRMPYSKQLSSNLYELRVRGKQEIRLFYSFFGRRILLLHAFIKKTQNTPEKELLIAEKRLAQFN